MLLNKPLAIIIAVGAVVLGVELLLMVLIDDFLRVKFTLPGMTWDFIDAITLTAVVSPVLYFLVFQKIQEGEERFRKINTATQDAIVIVNEQTLITDWNPAAQKMFQYSREEALGQQMHRLIAPPRYHDDAARGFARFEETGGGPLIGKATEIAARRKDGSEFPVELSISAVKLKGRWHAIGVIRDITERKHQQEHTAALLELATSAETLDEKTLLQQGLNTVQHLTGSRIGFLHFVSEDQNEIELVTWSTDTLAHYCQAAFDRHYPVSAAGIWADCIRLKQPVIVNDYATAPDKKGLPEGHSHLQRFISVPVFEGTRVRMIVGVGNAARDYDEHDVETVKLFSYDLHHIIQRKRAEQTLQGSESKYRRLIENSPDMIYTFSVERGCIYCSPQVISILGYSVEHLYAHPFLWNESIHPEDRAVVAKAIEEFKTGSPFKIEYRIRNAHGDWRWFYDRSIGGREENGDSIIEGVAMDITERKQIEATQAFLAESGYKHREENFFQALAKFLAQALSIDYVCIDRLEGDNLSARTLAIYFDGKFEDNVSYTLNDTPCGDVVAKKVCCFSKDVRHLFPQDAVLQEMLAESYVGTTLFDFNGKPIGLIAVIGRKPLANPSVAEALLRMVAVRAAAELERQKIEGELQEMLKAANQSRLIMLDVAEDQRRAEASLRQLNEELENKVLARTADLEQARHDAEAANQAKSSFLAAMSHEIRTPMNGVIGMVDMLHQSSLHGYQVEMVDLIRESAYSLLGIINDILDFSKIEADKLEIEYMPTRVADVVENVCGMLDSMAAKKGVELTLFTDPAIPAEVLSDAGRLRQVLVNLVNNALKFSSKQQRQGKVSVRAVLAENTPDGHGSFPLPNPPPEGEGANESLRDVKQILLEFRVTDNGIGMDAETLSGLFTPFTQADISTTRRFGGTGLGLSIAHHLVELMGGKITVQSEPGKGSTFTVHLPFELLPAKPAANAAESPVTGLSCLVVGGTGSLAGDMSAYLTHDGAMVELALNLAAAGERAGTLPPGMWVWVIDIDGEPPTPDELRAVARAHPEHQPRFVVIGRGPRRKPRAEDADLVLVDGNVLAHGILLKAVSIAAGRASVEQEAPLPGKGEAEFSPPSRDNALRQGRLILVAEDNETNQKVILRQLALLGFAADIADNGRIALERWRGGDYALLLSDLHMPEMDGYELTAAIRAAEQGVRHIPILALTANALKGEAEHCHAVGMDDYLSKPVQLADLKATLEKWLPVGVESAPVEPCSPHDNAGNIPGFHPGYIAPTAAPVDVNVLKKLVGDDEEIIRDFLHDFRISAGKIAVELRTACAAVKTAEAGALAHKLKSSARSVGALALGELCAEMEKSGKAGDMAALTMLLPRFEQEMASVEGFLEGY